MHLQMEPRERESTDGQTKQHPIQVTEPRHPHGGDAQTEQLNEKVTDLRKRKGRRVQELEKEVVKRYRGSTSFC
jgi:hypothetical protein